MLDKRTAMAKHTKAFGWVFAALIACAMLAEVLT